MKWSCLLGWLLLCSTLCVYSEPCSIASSVELEGAENDQEHGLELLFESAQQRLQFRDLVDRISLGRNATDRPWSYYHTLSHSDDEQGLLTLEDSSVWQVALLGGRDHRRWRSGDRLKVYRGTWGRSSLENIDSGGSVSVVLKSWPQSDKGERITRILRERGNPDRWNQLVLSCGFVFRVEGRSLSDSIYGWKEGHSIYPFHSRSEGLYELSNLSLDNSLAGWSIAGDDHAQRRSLLKLQERLTQRVIGQDHAAECVTSAVLNSYAGLKDRNLPVGVFLFLGPTGVGKTELAKALHQELYGNSKSMIRFDMAQFAEAHSLARLIGAPQGYHGHYEGGQLTNALKKDASTLVLLDEIEKSHPSVCKVFLSAFDEGYICSSKNERVDCKDTIFIMTSNLCSREIAMMHRSGYQHEDILEATQGRLMQELSPELYNRVEPIAFAPLAKGSMGAIVEIMLKEVSDALKEARGITLVATASVKEYLAEKGYSPDLGARPLKRVIKNSVSARVAYYIVRNEVASGSVLTLGYDPKEESWSFEVSLP